MTEKFKKIWIRLVVLSYPMLFVFMFFMLAMLFFAVFLAEPEFKFWGMW